MTTSLGVLLGNRKRKRLDVPCNELVLPTTDIGGEFEFEGVINNPQLFDSLDYFEHKEDASLHDKGREFVFVRPLFGQDLVEAIKEILTAARKSGWKTTKRTGIHFHMDARDLSPAQLLGIATYYALLEPVLYEFIGNNRDGNNFCLPWYKAEGSISDAASILRLALENNDTPKEFQALRETCSKFHKYAGCNFKPLAHYGSIEFRQLEATLDYDRVLTWLNLILSLKKAALFAPESTMAILHDLKTLPTKIFVNNVFNGLINPSDDALDAVREVGLPNAIDLIADAFSAAPKRKTTLDDSEALWQLPKKRTTENKSILAWKQANFPKGEEPKLEKPPPDFGAERLIFRNFDTVEFFAPATDDEATVVVAVDENHVRLNR